MGSSYYSLYHLKKTYLKQLNRLKQRLLLNRPPHLIHNVEGIARLILLYNHLAWSCKALQWHENTAVQAHDQDSTVTDAALPLKNLAKLTMLVHCSPRVLDSMMCVSS